MRFAAQLTWIQTAHWDNKSYDEFLEFDGDYQSYLVAAYLTEMQAQAVEARESVKEKQ